MKRTTIIIALILTTAVTAFSLTHKEQKAGVAKLTMEYHDSSSTATRNTVALATAD